MLERWTNKKNASVAYAPFAKDPLSTVAQLGRRLFTYALNPKVSGHRRMACANCHPDGRNDGLTWHIGEGPRQTPLLTGRLRGTAPFNWLGTEHKLTDNMAQTVRRLGGSTLVAHESKALATYIQNHLPVPFHD